MSSKDPKDYEKDFSSQTFSPSWPIKLSKQGKSWLRMDWFSIILSKTTTPLFGLEQRLLEPWDTLSHRLTSFLI